ncbi:MAG TPA: hypothetical protein VMH84_07740 [Xanthobacteraceae bacterium]|nr:hypothetical protein [Xanthobacteraceae bacterium]
MQVDGAVIREQGQIFAVVAVRKSVIDNRSDANRAVLSFSNVFRLPVVLMAQDSRGRPTYYGRPDIAKFLANVSLRAIPWRRYSIN